MLPWNCHANSWWWLVSELLILLSFKTTKCLRAKRAELVYQSAWDASTTETNFITALGSVRPRSRCWQGWFLVRPLFLLAVSSAGHFSVCRLRDPGSSGVSSSSCKDISPIELGPHPFDHIVSLKTLSPNTGTWWVGQQCMNFAGGGTSSACNTWLLIFFSKHNKRTFRRGKGEDFPTGWNRKGHCHSEILAKGAGCNEKRTTEHKENSRGTTAWQQSPGERLHS